MLVDTHCHIHDARFDEDREEVLKRARTAGVKAMISIGCDLETTKRAKALAQTHDDVYFSAGYHPHEAKEASEAELLELEHLAAHPKCVAIGECGLDYHYDHSPRDIQNQIFRAQIALAVRMKKALVIHVRDAFDDCLALLAAHDTSQIAVVIHCFTGTVEVAQKMLERGFYLSISGIVTFKDPGALEQVVAFAPLDRLLIETDAPYLAPLPYRGKRNEPAHVSVVADKVAALKGLSRAELEDALLTNARRVFHPDTIV